MKLHIKLVFFLVLVILVFSILDWSIQRFVVLPKFVNLEREMAERDVNRCIQALESEIHHLDTFTYDWSAWDDTYRFVQDANEEYIRANLVNLTFSGSHLDLIAFFSHDGRLVWGQFNDPDTQEPATSWIIPAEGFAADHWLVNRTDPKDADTGVLDTEFGPIIYSARPIVTTRDEGPVMGTMIMGRVLTQGFIKNLSRQTGVVFRVKSVASVTPEEKQHTLDQIKGPNDVLIHMVEDSNWHGHAAMFTSEGKPSLLIEADHSAAIGEFGKATVQHALASLFMAGLLVLTVLWVVLEAMVVSPILNLKSHLERIQLSGELTERVGLRRSDEIGDLSVAFDHMLDRIEADMKRLQAVEASLRESEGRNRTILETAPMSILSVDLDGRILSANPAAGKLFECLPDDLVGQQLSTILPDANEGGERSMEDLLERLCPSGIGAEIEGWTLDGLPLALLVNWSLVDLGDKRMFTVMARDISEHKRMHEKVMRAEHFAVIGEMSASIAHEIKNPLAGISGAMQVLTTRLPAEDPGREILDELQNQIQRLDKAVHDLLMYARPWTPERKATDLRKLCQSVHDALERQEGFKSIRFDVAEGDPVYADVDPALTMQVIWNLVGNARDAMPNGGVVTADVRRDRDGVVLTIDDNGPGMTRDVLRKTTQPFFTTKTRGTGLGLAVCQRIVEAHGGRLRIDSIPGAGTCVTIHFPASELD